jgi:hypothetical protein
MNGMYTLLLREKGAEDTPFFINIWPDSKRGPKQNDYLLKESHNKEGFMAEINQLIKKLQKLVKKVEQNTSAYKFVLKTDHVNEDKHIFYSLELVGADYEVEEDEQIVFFDNRIKGYKMDRIIKDMIKQLIYIGGITSTYSRSN